MAHASKLSFSEVLEAVTEDKESINNEDWTESVNDDRNAELPTYVVMKRALQTRINCASIIYSESRLWLVLIKRRLSGRQKIRNPFNGECQRDIPCAIFEALKAAVHSSNLDEFNEPNCYISSNRKASVISFTSLTSVVELFTVLSGYTCMEVRQYFTRNLKSNGKAELIVNQVKDFALIYKYKKGQLIINFNFGIWNANGFHNMYDCNIL